MPKGNSPMSIRHKYKSRQYSGRLQMILATQQICMTRSSNLQMLYNIVHSFSKSLPVKSQSQRAYNKLISSVTQHGEKIQLGIECIYIKKTLGHNVHKTRGYLKNKVRVGYLIFTSNTWTTLSLSKLTFWITLVTAFWNSVTLPSTARVSRESTSVRQ